MKKYLNFLLEKKNYLKNIDEEECLKILETSPMFNFLMKYGDNVDDFKHLIYRKVILNFGNKYNIYNRYNMVDPKVITRISPYIDNNIYNLLFSNLPSWEKYPKRNKSLICGDYTCVSKRTKGELMVVIPLENKPLAICPNQDIWLSFFKSIGKKNTSDNNYILEDIISLLKCNVEQTINDKINDKNYNKLIQQFEKYDQLREKISYSSDKVFTKYIIDKELCKKWYKKEISTLNLLDIIFNTKNNDFNLINYNDILELPKNREIWTDSNSILIDYYYGFKYIIEKLKKKHEKI
jgi:hypothetical protein